MAAFALLAAPLEGQQSREITVATRLRKEPHGIPLASLPAGVSVEPKRSRGNWREVMIQGWIFSRSVEKTTRDGFDLVVTAEGGENIRESPNGAVLGQVRSGTLLRKHEARGGWTKVSRTGWVPRDVVQIPKSQITPPAEPPPETLPADPDEPVETGALPAQGTAPVSLPDDSPPDSEGTRVARETVIFAAPQGGRYGTLLPGARMRVLTRSGEWARVQVEGWVRDIDLGGAVGTSLGGVTAAEVRADPPRYIGQTVDWRLELIAVQTADDLRSEMTKGQLYLLTRGPLPEPGFVYVTVTPAQAEEFRALQALQELTLRVKIKSPRTRFLSTPVVELVSRVVE
jgi:hypothetical protein